jgi:hypothetical protein
MVLADLGRKLTEAVGSFTKSNVVDDKVCRHPSLGMEDSGDAKKPHGSGLEGKR